MAQITVLDSGTIDKIAAGEVVNRPENAVKELVENAIDSGADAVTVEIKEGGISFIRVTDNGAGIEKSQVPKAFLRHATSKIKTVEDLLCIASLGFRGEALSSIAAVSQAELITKTPDDLTGIRYVIEGGAEKKMEEIGAPAGTTVIVRNLFYNTPARKKFLKTAQTEGSYISDLMERMALSKPDIAFQYIQNGQTKFHTSGNGSLKEIIYRIYGRDIAAELLEINAQGESASLYGYIGRPAINRANRAFENYFVNGRYIKSDIIGKALEEGYQGYLMKHKYPFAVLHFKIPQEYLDVNVHPGKTEIRFTRQNILYDFILRAVSGTLAAKSAIPEVSPGAPEKKARTQDIVSMQKKAPEPFEAVRLQAHKVAETAEYSVSLPKMQDILQNPPPPKIFGTEVSEEPTKKDSLHANATKGSGHILVEKPVQMAMFEEKKLAGGEIADYHILGQVFDTYWLVALLDRLFIIDQHAAHEKVKYEALLKQLKARETIDRQMLEPPLVVSLSAKEEAVCLEYAQYFQDLGFTVEPFGEGAYAVRSVPAELFDCAYKQLFTDILDELLEKPVHGIPGLIAEKLASIACKAAVKGRQALSQEEAKALIASLLTLENPYHCPHGRPTIISMSKYEIEKKFKRIV